MKVYRQIIYVICNNAADGFSWRSCLIPILSSSNVYVVCFFPDLHQSCCPCVCFSARVFKYVFLCYCDREGAASKRKNWSFSALSCSCCLFYPLLFAADVRTTFSLITFKGISCIWTIRWGHAWMDSPRVSRELVIIGTLMLCFSSNFSVIHFDSWKSTV